MKNLKLTIGLLIVALSVATGLKAQATAINGTIQDPAGEAIPFANVLLLNLPDSTLVTGVTSDMEGNFQLTLKEEGPFLLKISVVGFEEYYKEISGPGSISGEDLGVISLKEKSEMLKAVEVKAQRPLYISHPDKLVMDVENTSLYDGTSAFEVLSKSPGVWVDQNGEITLNGKKGVRVLLNDRPVYLSGDELKSMLEGMSSESIKNVEIIDNPSAKYDAEGAGGVININLKTESKRGLNGSLFANYSFNGGNAAQSGITLNGKKNRFSYFLNANGGNSRFMRDMQTRRTVEKIDFELTQSVEDRRNSLKPNVHTGFDYQLTENDAIGISYRGSGIFYEGSWDTRNNISENGEQLYADAFNYTERSRLNHMYNAHYTHEFDNSAKLSLDANYADLNSTANSTFSNYFTQDNDEWQEELSADNTSYFDIYSAQADFETNIPAVDATFESGAKYSVVNSKNELEFFTHEGKEKSYDSVRSNNFKYTERIGAAYISINKKISDKTTVKGGLRAEHTLVDGQSLQADESVTRDFLSLFPTLFIQHNWSENNETKVSYSRRITRANYQLLNPSIMYTDPYSYIQGNPLLRSQYTHGFSLTQVFAQQINVSLGYDVAKDFIAELPLQNPETNQTIFSIRNYDRMQNVNLRVLAPVQISKNWQSNTQLILAHQRFNTIVEGQALQNNKNMFSVRSTQSINLTNDFSVELLAAYQGPMAWGLYNMKQYWYADLAVKKTFMNKKLDVSLNVTDIFRTKKISGYSDIIGNTAHVEQYRYSQGIRLNLRYNFSFGDQFKVKKKNVDLDELKRAGGA